MSPRSVPRLASIDFLRGIVMVLMALDHTRGMVSGSQVDPTNLAETSPALFLTRWSTHFCAPIFVFLAGTAAFLSLARGKTKSELSRFLCSRGLWLIFLEFTVVRFGWSFRLGSPYVVGQVIWALGCSMIVLAVLIYLPVSVVTLFGITMVALHNLLDGLRAEDFGDLAWLWGILRGGYNIHLGSGFEFRPSYALIPWMGVMATGYGFGSLLLLERSSRRKAVFWLGIGLSATFLIMRALNGYGDPHPWEVQKSFLFSCFSFVNCAKYPPSLLFLLMTLGPGLLLLAALDKPSAPWGAETQAPDDVGLAHPFIVFGRVPMFFYLLHLPLIHLLAVIVSYPQSKLALGSFYYARPPAGSGYGFDLWVVYSVWLVALLSLFPACRWFAEVKRRRREVWLSYL